MQSGLCSGVTLPEANSLDALWLSLKDMLKITFNSEIEIRHFEFEKLRLS